MWIRFPTPPKIPGYKPNLWVLLLVLAVIAAIVVACGAFDLPPETPFALMLLLLLLVVLWKGREQTRRRRRGRD